jgi:hypothetical protein
MICLLVLAVQGYCRACCLGGHLVHKGTSLLMKTQVVVHHVCAHKAQLLMRILLQGFNGFIPGTPVVTQPKQNFNQMSSVLQLYI